MHGHSSHHPKGIGLHEGRLILYGCGDFLNDYDGISGHEAFRSDLVLAYFPTLAPSSGRLRSLEMTPFRTRRLRLERVGRADAGWLWATLDRESRTLGTRVELTTDGTIGEVSVLENEGHEEGGCMAPVNLLKGQGVEVLLAGGMGGRPLAGTEVVFELTVKSVEGIKTNA